MTVTTSESAQSVHLRERIQDLTHILERVEVERDLAIYRAHQTGMRAEELAHLALMTVTDVRDAIADCRRDPDVDAVPEGPDWIEFHRHDGWRVSA